MQVGLSITTDITKAKTSALTTTSAYVLSNYTLRQAQDYTFTGQYSYMDDLSTPATEGFGLMFYNARMYDPALERFTSADTIVPGVGNSQAWDRYSYVLNNPLRYSDPTGHSVCGLSGNGMCDKDEELIAYAEKTVLDYGGKNDLEAVVRIVDKAAKLYRTFDKMIPALSMIFSGVKESNPFTVWNSTQVNGCAGVGRDPINCPGNAVNGAFGDTGFNKDFRDFHNQIYHFWAYVATSAATDYPVGGYALGWFVGNGANIAHEIGGMGEDATKSGTSWQDYALAQEGMNTGTLIAFGAIQPNQLGDYIREQLETNSAGSPYVDPFVQYIPLWGNK